MVVKGISVDTGLASTTRCGMCHGQDPSYRLIELQTGLRATFCVACLRNTVRLLSHPQDLARSLQANR